MSFLTSIVLFFLLSCGLWVAEARNYNSVLTVRNGGRRGRWFAPQFCSKGYAIGFRIKEQPYAMGNISSSLKGITLLCDDGDILISQSGMSGLWKDAQYCHHGRFKAFALRAQEEGDNTAISNVKFVCSDNTELFGSESQQDSFGSLSNHCQKGSICGFEARANFPAYVGDDTKLNNMVMFCCD